MYDYENNTIAAMKRLTDKKNWNLIYERNLAKVNALKAGGDIEEERGYFCPYSDYFLWNVIYKKYLPKIKEAKVLEVGSAPGYHLVKLNKIYGYTPYGVEYSEPGVVQNKKVFSLYNLDPEKVIQADFFDEVFQRDFKKYFDIVMSRGFVEHFSDVEDVIDKHLNLLADGGSLVVSIPNLNKSSLYGIWAFIFRKERLKGHNLEIMTKEAFAKIFDRKDLSKLFCGYYGTLRLGLLSSSRILWVRIILYGLRIFDPILRLIFRDKGCESRRFSPYILYVGLKQPNKPLNATQ